MFLVNLHVAVNRDHPSPITPRQPTSPPNLAAPISLPSLPLLLPSTHLHCHSVPFIFISSSSRPRASHSKPSKTARKNEEHPNQPCTKGSCEGLTVPAPTGTTVHAMLTKRPPWRARELPVKRHFARPQQQNIHLRSAALPQSSLPTLPGSNPHPSPRKYTPPHLPTHPQEQPTSPQSTPACASQAHCGAARSLSPLAAVFPRKDTQEARLPQDRAERAVQTTTSMHEPPENATVEKASVN